MGGRGSGTWYRWSKQRRYGTVELVPFVLDVRTLARRGLLDPRAVSANVSVESAGTVWSVELRKNADGVTIEHKVTTTTGTGPPHVEHVETAVRIVWTPCHYGGRRPWWSCPCCWRRCASLYGTTRGGRFGWRCRTCSGLRYASTREGELDRARRRVRRIRQSVFGLRGRDATPFFDGGLTVPARPRGMWHRTYCRELARLDDAEKDADDAFYLEMAEHALRVADLASALGAPVDPELADMARTVREMRDERRARRRRT